MRTEFWCENLFESYYLEDRKRKWIDNIKIDIREVQSDD
jgi:hypothetical protein